MDDFDALLAEAQAAPVDGWDFSWFDGRATEQRPSWGYADRVAERLAGAERAALDVETGGGEVFAYAIGKSATKAVPIAVESWQPQVAARTLHPLGARVVAGKAEAGGLPFAGGSFDLVVSRHPVHTPWDEIARVLRPGGIFLSQQIGPGSNRELAEAMLGPLPLPTRQHPEQIAAAAEAAGLQVIDLRAERLRAEFFDVGAVAHFLRKVVWTVPGFHIERFRARLRDIHEEITVTGCFVSHAQRVLVEARA